MNDQFCRAGVDREVCYRTDGDPSAASLLLIAGLTLDLTSWPQDMIDSLVAQGFYVDPVRQPRRRQDQFQASNTSTGFAAPGAAPPPPGRVRPGGYGR